MNKSNQFLKVILLVFFISILSSCKSFNSIQDRQSQKNVLGDHVDSCMEPLFANSIPMEENPKELSSFEEYSSAVPPPSLWKKVIDIPIQTSEKVELLFFRKQDKENALWFGFKEQKETQVKTYSLESNEWNHEFSFDDAKEFFIDQKNQVWVIGYSDDVIKKWHSRLYIFDREQGELEAVLDKDSMLLEGFVNRFVASKDGTVWYTLIPKGSDFQWLVQFDVTKNKVVYREKVFDIISLGIDNQARPLTGDKKGEIRRYEPVSGQISSRKIPIDSPGLSWGNGDFLTTSEGNIWLSDRVWFRSGEHLGDLHVIFRSPVFVNKINNGYQPFLWERPSPLVDTEDGRIWFRSSRGLAWHQPETGEWCMFTTADSNIVKDLEGNLWLVYDNALYMLPASETRAKED